MQNRVQDTKELVLPNDRLQNNAAQEIVYMQFVFWLISPSLLVDFTLPLKWNLLFMGSLYCTDEEGMWNFLVHHTIHAHLEKLSSLKFFSFFLSFLYSFLGSRQQSGIIKHQYLGITDNVICKFICRQYSNVVLCASQTPSFGRFCWKSSWRCPWTSLDDKFTSLCQGMMHLEHKFQF